MRISRNSSRSAALALVGLLAFLAADARAVTIDWVPVGNPGNAADPADGDSGTAGVQHFGHVGYNYSIDKYDVTNSQYAEFLNTKDPTGANSLGLYNGFMADATYGGISFTAGNAAGSKYSIVSSRGAHPVNFTNWFDAIRFANWLNNGQGSGNTEREAYTLLGGTSIPSNADSIIRNVGATVVLPSEDEWYKAAFYNPATSSYFQYPTSSNTAPVVTAPPGTVNSANYDSAVRNPTDVGAYPLSMSPYGAFDMGGNVYQWTEGAMNSTRSLRGGFFDAINISSSVRSIQNAGNALTFTGFRVAEIPEPSSLILAAFGFLGLAAWGWRRSHS